MLGLRSFCILFFAFLISFESSASQFRRVTVFKHGKERVPSVQIAMAAEGLEVTFVEEDGQDVGIISREQVDALKKDLKLKGLLGKVTLGVGMTMLALLISSKEIEMLGEYFYFLLSSIPCALLGSFFLEFNKGGQKLIEVLETSNDSQLQCELFDHYLKEDAFERFRETLKDLISKNQN